MDKSKKTKKVILCFCAYNVGMCLFTVLWYESIFDFETLDFLTSRYKIIGNMFGND